MSETEALGESRRNWETRKTPNKHEEFCFSDLINSIAFKMQTF